MAGKARMTFRFDRSDPGRPGVWRVAGDEWQTDGVRSHEAARPFDQTQHPGGVRHPGDPEHPADAHAASHPPVPEDGLPFQDDVDGLERLIRGEEPVPVPFRPDADKPGSGTDDVSGDSGLDDVSGTAAGESGSAASGSAGAAADSRASRAFSVSGAVSDDSFANSELSREVSVNPSDPLEEAFDAFGAMNRRPEIATGNRNGGRPSPSGFRVFLALTGAIATGAVFGYLVLWLFVGQPWVSGSGGPAPNPSAAWAYGMDKQAGEADGGDGEGIGGSGTAEESPVRGDGNALAGKPGEASPRETAGGSGPPEETAPAAAKTMVIPADLFYFLQYGVFSSEERMKEALRTVRNKGLAAVAAQGDGYRVFVGAAPTRDDAERLAKLLGDLQVYIKVSDSDPLVLPADGLPADLPAFFERSGELAREAERLSLALLRKDTPSEEAWQRLRETHRLWRQTADALEGDTALAGEAQTLALRVAGRLDAAVRRLEDGRGGDRSAPWDAQSAVMEALLDLERLRETLKSAVPTVAAG